MINRSYGLESEKVFVDSATGDAVRVGDDYFSLLADEKQARGLEAERIIENGQVIGVKTTEGQEGLDGSFNMGESSTRPLSESDGGLSALGIQIDRDLADVQTSLAHFGAGVLNMSNHPLLDNDMATSARFSIPRPNSYAREVRGWNHLATVNSRVQNSPSTSVTAFEAGGAMTAVIGLGSVMIALYANSPFEHGMASELQESRLKMWEEYYAGSNVAADRRLYLPPERPFRNLRDYLNWMFGDGTSLYFVGHDDGSLPNGRERTALVDGNPSVLEYLRMPVSPGMLHEEGSHVQLQPKLGHMARNQFMQFCGARLRYTFGNPDVPPDEFLNAMDGSSDEVERFFETHTDNLYIEARDPGTNFADAQLADADSEAADSVYLSPSAMQAGIISNLPDAIKCVREYDWSTLMALRELAAKDGLHAVHDNVQLSRLAGRVIEIAAGGLAPDEQWMLAYPKFVLRTGNNGAVRARKLYEQSGATTEYERVRHVILSRVALKATRHI